MGRRRDVKFTQVDEVASEVHRIVIGSSVVG